MMKSADWLQEGFSLSAVSARNTILFTSSTLLTGRESPLSTWGCHLYTADLNMPWDATLITSTESAITSLAWDTNGERFVMSDLSGTIYVYEIEDNSISDWRIIANSRHNHERFISASFFAKSRPISLNSEQKDSLLYTEKFSAEDPAWARDNLDGCVLVSSTGLLVVVAFNADNEPVFKTASVGIGRRKTALADIATNREGQLMIATSGNGTLVVIYTVVAGFNGNGDLSVRVNSHSSFSVRTEDASCVTSVKFLLSDSTESLVIGVSGVEGGKVQCWDLQQKPRTVHKLFCASSALGNPPPRVRNTPEWVFSDEFCGGGSSVVALSSPSFSLLGGKKPGCYIGVAFSDGSVQLLLRDGLAQIASVELPRGGNIAWAKASQSAASVTICSMSFTSTGNCLLITDSFGQMYLYRLSPISDPGGPTLPPYIVTILEYCLVTGRDWWDLAIAADSSKLEAIGEKLSQNFARQPLGQQEYFYPRFMAMKSSLFRLTLSSQFKSADTIALLMIKSITGAFKGLLKGSESNFLDYSDPSEKLSKTMENSEDVIEIESVIQSLLQSGISRDHQQDASTVLFLQQLSLWVITLCLHLLTAVPEFKSRKGPGYALLHDGQSLSILRELLVMIRLWNISKVNIICTEKGLDLTARLFSMISKLKKKPDEESLMDECLMLPHRVIVPPLDTMFRSKGILANLHNLRGSTHSFTFGSEPEIPTVYHVPTVDGLTYTDQHNSDFYYDTLQKIYLGQSPSNLRQCTRCTSVTQTTLSKSTFAKLWDRMWSDNCLCGGPWRINKD